ncbi:MAG TPA: hypothetical protein VF704_12735, partial [Allosphingosinicella sp.]
LEREAGQSGQSERLTRDLARRSGQTGRLCRACRSEVDELDVPMPVAFALRWADSGRAKFRKFVISTARRELLL